MNVNFGNLELNRTNSAHLGTSPVGVTKVGGQDEKSSAQKPSFESFLMDAVSEMNRQQMEVSAIQEKVITDPDSVDIHDVTVAMAKAQSSLNLAQTVIDRLVKGWNDLSQNR